MIEKESELKVSMKLLKKGINTNICIKTKSKQQTTNESQLNPKNDFSRSKNQHFKQKALSF